jgi:hypothetical protein
MKKNTKANLFAVSAVILVILITKSVSILPWWFFIVPVLGTGILIGLKKWKVSVFIAGFTAGFLTWIFTALFFDITLNCSILSKWGIGLKIFVFVVTGIMGGVLSGLALYTGKSMVSPVTKEMTL